MRKRNDEMIQLSEETLRLLKTNVEREGGDIDKLLEYIRLQNEEPQKAALVDRIRGWRLEFHEDGHVSVVALPEEERKNKEWQFK